MISSASSSDRSSRAEALKALDPLAHRGHASRSDRISTESAAFLRAELVRQPEIRADEVARARELVASPGYPSREILAQVAGVILAAPDLSTDES